MSRFSDVFFRFQRLNSKLSLAAQLGMPDVAVRHVLKPETTKRSHRNERNETTETSETTCETTKTKNRYDNVNTIRNDQNKTTGQQKTELSFIYDFLSSKAVLYRLKEKVVLF